MHARTSRAVEDRNRLSNIEAEIARTMDGDSGWLAFISDNLLHFGFRYQLNEGRRRSRENPGPRACHVEFDLKGYTTAWHKK